MRKKEKRKSFFYSNQFLIGALVLAILLAVGFARAYFKDYSSIKEIRVLQEEAKRLETEQISLLELLEYVKSDAYVEQEARTKLQYKEPGEEVVVFTNVDKQKDNIKEKDNTPNWRLWLEYFFSNA